MNKRKGKGKGRADATANIFEILAETDSDSDIQKELDGEEKEQLLEIELSIARLGRQKRLLVLGAEIAYANQALKEDEDKTKLFQTPGKQLVKFQSTSSRKGTASESLSAVPELFLFPFLLFIF